MFKNEGTEFEVKAIDDTVILIVSEETIPEQIVAPGPFVMNTSEQINQAIIDYKSGKFGNIS